MVRCSLDHRWAALLPRRERETLSRGAESGDDGRPEQMSLSVERRAVLEAVCDTVVPALERPDDPEGFWARSAGDVGAPAALEAVLELRPPEEQLGIDELLDGLAESGFLSSSRRSREQILRNVAALTPAAAAGIQALTGLTLFLTYGAPDPGRPEATPSGRVFAYPGAGVVPAPEAPRTITPLVPEGDELTLEADAVVIGSGAGGGVIAASLAEAGLEVVVLEASGYYDEAQFNGYELWAYQNMYWRGGPQPTADLNMTLQAGATLGGGTTINWTNCLRTRPWVREQWAREHGLTGVDGPEFDAHLDAVFERLSVNDRCSDLNGTQQRMKEGAEALGWSFRTDPAQHRREPLRPRERRLHRLRGPLRGQADHHRDLPGGRRRARQPSSWCDCFVDRDPDRGRPGPGRGGHVPRPRHRPAAARQRARAAGRGGRGLARVARAAAALGHRRPGHRQNLHLHPCTARVRELRRGPACLVGRAAGRARGRVRRGGGRPRLPARGHPVRARHRRPRRCPSRPARSTRS